MIYLLNDFESMTFPRISRAVSCNAISIIFFSKTTWPVSGNIKTCHYNICHGSSVAGYSVLYFLIFFFLSLTQFYKLDTILVLQVKN